ncbi:hypothetical protein RDWZM_009643 [Blomia tropicalis]|uniref:Uncharacterized protein n=1 Tax=Blomia tropicalis TaxID=40697 RepID=A0A9Q0RMH2_BLOTA|nr:hypothetical protein RDWZM_009643 [Blomia tropicalis]
MDDFVAFSTDESFLSNNSSLSGERNGDAIYVRFAELEKKIADQADEIVCLKSTLADVLRRLSQLEGRAIVTTSHHISNNHQNGSGKTGYSHRTGTFSKQYQKPVTNGNGYNTEPYSNIRRMNLFSSSTSLQNDVANSNNVSPVSSPLPSHSSYRSMSLTGSSNGKTGSSTLSRLNSNSNLKSMKRWSVSQEIRLSSLENSSFKDFFYNQVEGVIRFMLNDRPIIINIPTELLQTYTIKNVTSPPSQRLKLEWVYGYRGKDCRHNLYLLPTGEIVYFMAAVVVLYNVDDQIQRHYTGHTSEIRCLTIHPNKLLIATGQAANNECRYEKRPQVRIWDSVSLNTLHIIGLNGEFDRGVCCLTFSKLDGGNLLCVVDDSNDHVLSLWEWQKGSNGHRLSESKSTCDPVLAIEFHPIEKYTLISIGKGHIFFWDVEGGTLVKKIGVFEKQEKPKYILCLAFNDLGELLTGDSNGNIIVWHQNTNRIVRIIHNAHDGAIFDICTLKDGKIVSGGGKDKKIVEWDSNMSRTGREAKLPDQFGGIRTLTTGKGSMLFVGTTKNCILQGTMTLNFSMVVQGHTDELNALAIHPTQNQFVTAGYDKCVHLWDTMSHLVVWSKDIGESAHAASFSPDGSILIVSTASIGRWIVFDATTRQMISMHNDGADLIECVKFSPDGRYLALGSRDHNIYVYQVSEEYRQFNRVGRCSAHTSSIVDIDWDKSNTYLQSTSTNNEYLFWNATICRQLNNMSIARDLEFYTHNSVFGFNVFGIWPENFDSPDVRSCDRSHSYKLLVTGDDFGRLGLFSYPACQPKCLNHSYSGHSDSVASVRFLSDDSRIISIGGRDSSIMQWSVS